MDNTTSSYETASSTLVSRKVKHKRSGTARDKEIAAVMELIECIERDDDATKRERGQPKYLHESTAAVPPAHPTAHHPLQGYAGYASLPVPQDPHMSGKEAPKAPSPKYEDETAKKSEHVQRRFPDEATAERPPGHPPAHPPKQGSGAAPAGKDASPPEPQHWYKSREEAPKPPSTRPEAKKGTRWASRSKYLWPTTTFKSNAPERDKPTVPAEAKDADWKSDAAAGAPTTPRAVNLGAHDTKAFGSPKTLNEGEPKYPKASGGPKAPSREEHKYPKASGTTKAPDSEEPTDPKAYRTPAQYWAEPKDPKAPLSTTAQNSEEPTYSTPKARNEAEREGKPHDVKLADRPKVEKEGEAKKESHDLKSPNVPKSDDKKPVEEKPVQKHVVSSPRVQPHAGEDRGAPDATLKDHPAKRERTNLLYTKKTAPSKREAHSMMTRISKLYCAWITMILVALFAVTLALAMAALGFVERERNRDHPVLKGKFGAARGRRIVITDQGNEYPVYAFLGIPFAKPPLGTLRFKPPVPLDDEEDEAMKPQDRQVKRPPCPQQDFYLGMQNVSTTNASEDCLHLNIWAPPSTCDPWPQPNAQGDCKLRTVLLFLYGAAFQNGANSFELYDGQYLSALGDLVVVVPNYRVGALGFLSGPSAGVLPGNAGLYDQRLALSWTLNNIENFGGNASRLVLAGHDAGAASLGYHLFRGDAALFTRNVARYILQGGGPFNRYKDDGAEGAHLLATNLQCGSDLSAPTTLRCLQNSHVDAVARSPIASRFAPLLNRTPVARGMSSSADKRKVVGPQGKQFLLGRVVSEGVYPWYVEHMRTGSSEPLHLATRLIGRKALEQWQTATGVTLRQFDGDMLYQQAVGDVLEVCPMSDLAELLQALENRVYVYVLGYRPKYSSWPDVTEAVRFEDMHMVFGMPFRPGVPSSELDKQWSRTMITVWSTFAHTGKAPALDDSRWPVYDPLQPSYMKLGADGVSMERDTKRPRCDFLRSHRNPH